MFLTITIASNIDDIISRTRKSPLDYLGRKSESSFLFFPTDTTEVECIIAEFKNGKALGPYPYIQARLLLPFKGRRGGPPYDLRNH